MIFCVLYNCVVSAATIIKPPHWKMHCLITSSKHGASKPVRNGVNHCHCGPTCMKISCCGNTHTQLVQYKYITIKSRKMFKLDYYNRAAQYYFLPTLQKTEICIKRYCGS